MILSHIAALAKNRCIGIHNRLPWRIPEDLRYFKEKTLGKIVIMGRKTFESLPSPLDDRFLVVLSQQSFHTEEEDIRFVKSLDQALACSRELLSHWPEEVFIAGGADVYRQTLGLVDRLYLTEIDQDYEGDSFYPEFSLNEFYLYESVPKEKPLKFSFNTYKRIQTKA